MQVDRPSKIMIPLFLFATTTTSQSSEGMDTTTEKWLFQNNHKKKMENKNMFLLPVPACLPGEQF
tara:strand:+ start:1572 stop:1766 length:195 start_codon:yes stop_codon:yes gene_type:complete